MRPDPSQSLRDQHASLAAVLRSLLLMMDRGPGDEPERFFDVLRAMLFYIDEFPERRHHKRESEVLFPLVLKVAPELAGVIEALEADHQRGEANVRELQHLLLAWELLGDSRRAEFERRAHKYVRFYLDHMRVEETEVLPVAMRLLGAGQWAALDAAFRSDPDPLAAGSRDGVYDRLYTRILMTTPAPIGVGPELARTR